MTRGLWSLSDKPIEFAKIPPMSVAGRTALLLVVVVGLVAAGPATGPSPLDPLVKVLDGVNDPAVQHDVLRGMYDAMSDRRGVPMPAGWENVARKLGASPDPEIRHDAMLLSLLFGDPRAMASLHELVANPTGETKQRYEALQLLVQTHDPTLVPLLDKLLDDPQMTGSALNALAAYEKGSTPALILEHYPRFSQAQKRDALSTLTSRAPFARALLDAVGQGRVPKQDLTAFDARQIVNLNDKALDQQLRTVWGEVRATSHDKLALLAQYRKKFPPDVVQNGNASHGRMIFSKTCGVCHTLFDSGGDVGPNLTGAQRTNLDYVLGKVLDPSAVVSRDYRMTIVRTKDGRVVNGIVQHESDAALTLKAPGQTIVVQKDEIDKRKLSDSSLMPEGLLSGMSDEDIRDLLAYLGSPKQVPLQQ